VVATKGLYVVDTAYDDPAAYAHWLEISQPAITALLGSRTGAPA
jgi:FMN reductase